MVDIVVALEEAPVAAIAAAVVALGIATSIVSHELRPVIGKEGSSEIGSIPQMNVCIFGITMLSQRVSLRSGRECLPT